MKARLSIVTFLIMVNWQVDAQFKSDAQKVSAIRWTPEKVKY
jgi:hypothetical protein